MVHALGVVHALHAAYPSAQIAWAIQGEFAGLVEGMPGLSRVIRFGRRESWRAWLAMRRDLREFGANVAVDCQGNLKSAGVVLLSGAKRRLGPARADWREPLGARVMNEFADAVPGGAKHAMDRMAALVRQLVPTRSGPLRLDAGLSDEELQMGDRALALHLPAGATRPALVHISSGDDIRGWPAERWCELIGRLRDSGRGAIVLSGPHEAALGAALRRRLGESELVSHWVGQRGLRTLAAVFHSAARRGLSLVGCDSGPAHLAAAHGLGVVLLAGPQDATRTGPWPLGARGPHVAVGARQRPACQPCLSRKCEHVDGPVCMSRIECEDILRGLERVSPDLNALRPFELNPVVAATASAPRRGNLDPRHPGRVPTANLPPPPRQENRIP